jgi:flavin-dependent dehydrogenase
VLVGRYRDVGRWRPYRGHALAVSREILDGVLADRLRVLPVDFREEVCVTDVIVEDGAVVGVRTRAASEVRAPLVIAADGRSSVIAHRLGCRRPHRLQRMALATYVSGVDDCRDHGEIFVDPPDYSILNPIAPDRVNLSLVVPLADAAPWSGRLETFFAARVKQVRHLARRVAGARLEAPVQAMGPLAYRVFTPREGGVLLVGDAAGFYDPFTGEGIFSALRGAELAAETVARALDRGDVSARALAGYARARRAAFADKTYVTRGLQAIIRRRRLANLSARLLRTRPGLLDLVLGVVGDYVPPRALLGPLAAA